ncbi:flagellar biosynthetic protein FliO, partial [Hansschlegelia beijingensis]|uniref:flagellar biosynthetic protein FliO n=1 Tax=Hansschlegelia beijingensis TaxID=1133344 RepID=UPI00387F1BA3
MFDQFLGDVPTPLKFILAFAVVILLVVLAAWLMRRFSGQGLSGGMGSSGRSRQPRLGVLDVLAIDGRRRLVIVRRDNVEHLVMIGEGEQQEHDGAGREGQGHQVEANEGTPLMFVI